MTVRPVGAPAVGEHVIQQVSKKPDTYSCYKAPNGTLVAPLQLSTIPQPPPTTTSTPTTSYTTLAPRPSPPPPPPQGADDVLCPRERAQLEVRLLEEVAERCAAEQVARFAEMAARGELGGAKAGKKQQHKQHLH